MLVMNGVRKGCWLLLGRIDRVFGGEKSKMGKEGWWIKIFFTIKFVCYDSGGYCASIGANSVLR